MIHLVPREGDRFTIDYPGYDGVVFEIMTYEPRSSDHVLVRNLQSRAPRSWYFNQPPQKVQLLTHRAPQPRPQMWGFLGKLGRELDRHEGRVLLQFGERRYLVELDHKDLRPAPKEEKLRC